MTLLRVNIGPEGAELHGRGRQAGSTLARAARASDGPIIVMVHGWSFEPGHSRHCPHRHILGTDVDVVQSWPEGLGFRAGAQNAGLGVAIGWQARCSLREAYIRAGEAGRMLSSVISSLRLGSGGRPVHAIGHSLGARVILSALPYLAAGDVGRIVALAGAEWQDTALDCLDTPAGRAAELINVTWKANAAFDMVFARLLRRNARPMGAGLGAASNRVDMHLDCPDLHGRLAALGYPLAPLERMFCHWSGYENRGALALHAALMRTPEALPLSLLTSKRTERVEPRFGLLRTA
jgi:hypothetical protein